MKRVLVYKDLGVSGRSYRATIQALRTVPWKGLQIEAVNSLKLQDFQHLKDASLLIIPGGRDLPYVEKLKGPAKKNIRKWVEEGGSYFGICAGAYFGSSYVLFEGGGELEVCGERELKFFEGTAEGPAFGSGVFRYNTEAGARAALIKVPGTDLTCSCYFNGGCTFKEELALAKVSKIAHYEEIQGMPPAIIKCAVGAGMAILSGVHPEFSADFLDEHNPYLQSIALKVKETEENRKRLFDALTLDLLRCCRRSRSSSCG